MTINNNGRKDGSQCCQKGRVCDGSAFYTNKETRKMTSEKNAGQHSSFSIF
ncbi:uncharacterized protein METZ01_LOCUS180621 [marine metagenome]|uniref:Uncharacterized protein n=1 Tax=marine metagenome TaxID=408172 RepID=A0A382CR52_9ZZZZ